MVRLIARLLVLLLLVPATSTAAEPAAGSATRTAVQAFVKGYVEAANKGDITALMEMVSHKDGVTSIGDGEIARGWEAIRQGNDDMLGTEGSFKISVGSIDVMPMGASTALAVAPLSTTVAAGGVSVQTTGALTLVLEKTAGKWLIIHEHVSHQIPEAEGD